MDRIRFAIKHMEQFAPHTEPMQEAGLQLLDALERLESAERNFQSRFRRRQEGDSGLLHTPAKGDERRPTTEVNMSGQSAASLPLVPAEQSSRAPNIRGMEADGALERHFSIQQVAELWGLCENSVRELFKEEPGVIRIQRPRSRYKRAYTTVRIPKSVLERVHRRMSLIGEASLCWPTSE